MQANLKVQGVNRDRSDLNFSCELPPDTSVYHLDAVIDMYTYVNLHKQSHILDFQVNRLRRIIFQTKNFF